MAKRKPKSESNEAESNEANSEESQESAAELTPFEQAAAKVRTFPQSPGVYLMKDAAGVVIYIGKATNLRSRAGSYLSLIHI